MHAHVADLDLIHVHGNQQPARSCVFLTERSAAVPMLYKSSVPLDLRCVELQRQFLALRRAGALPLQARLERRSLSSGALLTHRELSFIFSLGASLPPFLPNQVTL